MSDKESKSHGVDADSAPATGGSGSATRGAPGKRTRTLSMSPSDAAGPSTKRLRPQPSVARFDLTEIGRERTTDLTLTNTSDKVVDFFDFLQTILPASDGVVRPEGDFAVVGGETTGEGLAPGASTALTVAFRPQATGPRDLEKGKKTLRKASLSVLDTDGAVAGTIPLEGVARPPSAETLDAAAVTDLQGEARRAGRSHAVPRSFDDIRRQLLAARDLIGTSERDAASELMDGLAERFAQALTYEHVYQAARKHGLGAMTATQVVAAARDELNRVARNLHGTGTVLPAHMDKLVSHLEVAKEPIQLTLGEIKSAPSLQAMNDANPVVMGGHAARELGKTAVELATDAAFAAGFGVGVLRGAGGALVDLAAGVADAARLAYDLARAWLTGGMIGVALEVAGKVDAFFTKMPAALQAMGKSFQDGWNDPDSFDRGSFRGEVISYVAAQIAIIIVSGGAASEGVAFASLSRWGKVARLIEMLDAAGDITTWARGAAKAVERADELLDQVRRLRRTMKVEAPHSPRGPHGPSPHGPDADAPDPEHGHRPNEPAAEGAGVGPDRTRPPYQDPRIDADGPRRPLDRRELEPYRRIDHKASWAELEKAQRAGSHSFALGRKLKTADEGHAMLARLSSGDASALEVVGIKDYPKGFDPTGREWALVELRDGFALFVGGYNHVELPSNVRLLGHTHPGPVAEVDHNAPDVDRSLRRAPDGGGLSFGELLEDLTNARDSGLLPSAADVNAISDGTQHVLYTRFAHAGDGKLVNPGAGDPRPRVQIHLSDAKVLRWDPRARSYWYEVTAVVKDATGKQLWSGPLYAQWSAMNRMGDIFPRKPPHFPAPSNPRWETP